MYKKSPASVGALTGQARTETTKSVLLIAFYHEAGGNASIQYGIELNGGADMEQTAIDRFLIYIKQQRLRQIGVDAVVTIKRKEPKNERN